MARSRSSLTQQHAAARRRVKPLTRWPIPKACGQTYVDKVHERDLATPETADAFGIAEPRIATPPLRELTPETSLGFEVIDFADEVLGIELMPWQRAALIRMLELREDGELRFRTVVILVARQQGKSTLAQVLTIWLLCVWGWPLILGTAQDLDVAETLWQEVVDIVDDNEELSDLIDRVVKVNGKKSLNLTSGGQYKVKAANRRAGRGLSGNLVLLDELREHQTWDAWGAITKTTMARAEAMILALSNAGDVTSRVLRYLRIMAHRELGDPDGIGAAEEDGALGPTQFDLETLHSLGDEPDADDDDDDLGFEDLAIDELEQDSDTLCLLEWSAAPGLDKRDRGGWRQACPAIGYAGVRMSTIAAACKTDPEWVFRTEVLCQWNDGATLGPWQPGSWEETTVPTEKDEHGTPRVTSNADRIVGPVVAGIAQSADRSLTWIAFAGLRADGTPQVEMVTCRYGSDWVESWLTHKDRKGRVKAVTGQTRGAPEATLLKKLKASRKFHLPIEDLAGSDLLDAHADAYDALAKGEVWHTPWPALDLAAQTAEKKILAGGTWVLDPAKSPTDIASLRAWIAALWLLLNRDTTPPPPPPPPAALRAEDAGDSGDHAGLTDDLGSVGF